MPLKTAGSWFARQWRTGRPAWCDARRRPAGQHDAAVEDQKAADKQLEAANILAGIFGGGGSIVGGALNLPGNLLRIQQLASEVNV